MAFGFEKFTFGRTFFGGRGWGGVRLVILSRKLFHDIVTKLEKFVPKMNTSKSRSGEEKRKFRLKITVSPKTLYQYFIYLCFGGS